MKEERMKPIIFSSEMIRAILDRQKTMTRRVIKPQPVFVGEDDVHLSLKNFDGEYKCPYGKIGDRLWVRETWYKDDKRVWHKAGYYGFHKIEEILPAYGIHLKWKSPIFMPRWASRITLEITDIRVERLQEINLEDIAFEGILFNTIVNIIDYKEDFEALRQDFRNYWNSIHKKQYRWQDKPWVWVISFKRTEEKEVK